MTPLRIPLRECNLATATLVISQGTGPIFERIFTLTHFPHLFIF